MESAVAISIDKAFGIHQAAAVTRARRAGLIATNLANADTPGYKARDIDFREALAQAGGARDAGQPRRTHERHLGGGPAAPGDGGLEGVKFRIPLNPSLDGNTVDVNVEQAAFAKNSLMYQASLHFLDRRVKGLTRVIKGE